MSTPEYNDTVSCSKMGSGRLLKEKISLRFKLRFKRQRTEPEFGNGALATLSGKSTSCLAFPVFLKWKCYVYLYSEF